MSRKLLLLVIAATLLPPVVLAAAWMREAHHAVIPGLRGCDRVRDSVSRTGCYGDRLTVMVETDGLVRTRSLSAAHARRSGRFSAVCHMAWHVPGERAGRRDARADSKLRRPASTSFCDEGYVHGYLIGWTTTSSTDVDPERARGFCTRGFSDIRARANCAHSFGHVFARARTGDPEAATDRCNAMFAGMRSGEEASLAADCNYGAWMEVTLQRPARTRAEVDNCGSAPPIAQIGCVMFLPARMRAVDGDRRAVSRTCRDLPSSDLLAAICANYLGYVSRSRTACTAIDDASLESTCLRATLRIGNPQAVFVFDDLLFSTPDARTAAMDALAKPRTDRTPDR